MFFEKLDTPGAVVQNVVAVAGIGEPLSHGLRRYLGLLVRMPEGLFSTVGLIISSPIPRERSG
jgi:hypothetical protein